MKPDQTNDLSLHVAGLLQEPVGARRLYAIHQPNLALDDASRAQELSGKVRLTRVNRGILAEGYVDAALVLECSRCLAPFATRLRAPLEEQFRQAVEVQTGTPVALTELDEPEEEFPRIRPDHVLDLSEVARQAILVTAPYSPICRDDCAGLCAVCGADLNFERCGHTPERSDPSLGGLAALLDQIEDTTQDTKRSDQNGRTA
jgi:uncharacterized protein